MCTSKWYNIVFFIPSLESLRFRFLKPLKNHVHATAAGLARLRETIINTVTVWALLYIKRIDHGHGNNIEQPSEPLGHNQQHFGFRGVHILIDENTRTRHRRRGDWAVSRLGVKLWMTCKLTQCTRVRQWRHSGGGYVILLFLLLLYY